MLNAHLEQSRDPAMSQGGRGGALVPLTLQQASEATPFFEQLRVAITNRDRAFRPDARFVAHLIATAAHAPQTRAFGRAAPGDVTTSYSGAAATTSGLALSRVA